jgi:hypothetical protein
MIIQEKYAMKNFGDFAGLRAAETIGATASTKRL